MSKLKISHVIRDKRKFLKMTLRDVEAITGISNAYLSQLENGQVGDIGFSKIIKISAALEIPILNLVAIHDYETRILFTAPSTAVGEDVRKVVSDHIADLLRCAAILEKQTGWNKTAAEIRLAANELTAAMGEK